MKTLTHSKYGQGTLISEENGKATIKFAEGTKTLVVKFAKLLNEDGTLFEGSTELVLVDKPENKYHKSGSTKKLNPANFMSKEEWAKSLLSKMSKDEAMEYCKQTEAKTLAWWEREKGNF